MISARTAASLLMASYLLATVGCGSSKSGADGTTTSKDGEVVGSGGQGGSGGDASVAPDGGFVGGVDAPAGGNSTGTVAISVPGLGAAGFNYTQGSYLIGFVFRPNTAIRITQLGYYDANLTGGIETFQPHTVGVYELTTHTLLGSATVQPSDPVTGVFRYVSLTTPIALSTTGTFAIVGVTGTDKYSVGITAREAPVNAAITYLSSAGYGPSNNNATMTSTLVEPNAFDAGNIFGQAIPTSTLCDFGPNFIFVTSSGGSDTGVDASVPIPADAAASSDTSTASLDSSTS